MFFRRADPVFFRRSDPDLFSSRKSDLDRGKIHPDAQAFPQSLFNMTPLALVLMGGGKGGGVDSTRFFFHFF